MKKSLIVLFLVALFSAAVFAIPQQINYQGRLNSSSGAPLTGTYSVVFTIYDAVSGGTNLWSETQSVTCESGLFSVLLGSVTPIPTGVFTGEDRWLGVKVGSDSEMTPRQKLVSVGNAFQANNADNLGGHPAGYFSAGANQWTASGNDIYSANSGNVGIGIVAPEGQLDVIGGTQGTITTIGSEVPGLILQQRYGTGGWGPELEFRTNDGGNVWTNAAIASKDPLDGTYAGELAFFTQPGGSSDPAGRRSKGASLIERMRINKSGNVGIGTTSPGYQLDVNGTGNFANTISVNSGSVITGLELNNNDIHDANLITINDPGAGEGFLFNQTAGNFVMDVSPLARTNADGNLNLYGTSNNIAFWRPTLFVYNASNYATATPLSNGGLNFTTTGTGPIAFGGNVGIGTTAPAQKLSVAGTIEITAGSGGGLKFADGTILNTASGSGGSSQWTTSGSNIYYTAGSVSVGTTEAAANNFYVDGNVTVTDPNFGYSLTSGVAKTRRYGLKYGSAGTLGDSDLLMLTNREVNGQLAFATDNGSGGAVGEVERMRINNSGYVGIGTTAPVVLLDLAGVNRQVERLTSYSSTYTDYRGNAAIVFQKSHSNTPGTLAATLNGEDLGALEFQAVGSDNAAGAVAKIYVTQAGNAASGGSWHTPGKMTFILTNVASPGNTITPLVLDYTGNVGIGTTAPTSPLTVAGTIEITAGSGGGLKFADGSVQTSASGAASQWTTSGSDIYYTTGKVGIGTTNPGERLHLYTTADWSGIQVQHDAVDNRAGKIYFLKSRAGGPAAAGDTCGALGFMAKDNNSANQNVAEVAGVITNPTAGSVSGDLVFRTAFNSGWFDRVRILSTGFVGIGTSNPGEVLEVATADATVRIRNVNDSGGAFIGDTWGSLQLGIYNPTADLWGSIPANSKQTIFAIGSNGKVGSTAINASGSNYGNPPWRNLLDNGAGNASIGTTDATSRLTVAGTIEIKAGYGGGLKFADGTIQTSASGGKWTTSGSDIYYTTGNVGIGTTNPLYPLHVSKSTAANWMVALSNPLSGAASVYVSNGNGEGAAVVAGSSLSAASYAFKVDKSSTNYFYVKGDGKVGVGTTAPGYILDVQDASSKVNSKNGYLTNGADYAEYFENEENIPAGSLVGIDTVSGKARTYRSGDEYVGIASTASSAGYVGNSTKEKQNDPGQTLVGLLGQLDLKSETAKIVGRIVYTPDMKKVGILLSNNKVFVGK